MSLLDKDKFKKLIDEREVTDQEGLQDVLRDLTKEVIDTLYEGELTEHLGYEKHDQGKGTDGNVRNGKGTKTVKSHFGPVELEPPRDRAGTFYPQVVKKRQRDISGIEQRVISMYAKGMSTRDISSHIHEIYGYELSAESVSAITEKVIERAKEWQSRQLQPIYAVVFLAVGARSLVVKMRIDGSVKKQTIYIILGIDLEGNKSCLGLYFAETESAKYWLSVMNQLHNRGVEDVLIYAVDNLKGISEAIEAVYPKAEIQKCIVHQIRNSLRFVSSEGEKNCCYGPQEDLHREHRRAGVEGVRAIFENLG